jgi:hypothetical protein
MKKQITNISPIQTAKVFAVLSMIATIPFWLLMLVPMMAMPRPTPPFFSGMFLLMPIFYAVFGFIFTAVGAWLYNLMFKYIGGVEFSSAEIAPQT